MTTEAISPKEPGTGTYKRYARNYLIDSRFQLKYAGFLVATVIVISGVTGAVLYTTTRALVTESSALVEESKKVSEVSRMNIRDFASDSPELLTEFNREANAHDKVIAEQQESLIRRERGMIASLVGGLALMVVLIGMLGIYFTHKVAGPVHKMKRLLKQVGEGSLHVDARLRRGDELQDFFDAFTEMVASLRRSEAQQLGDVDAGLAALEAGKREEAVAALGRVRAAMKSALGT
jgi:methyl-accepting chemotaxis protein